MNAGPIKDAITKAASGLVFTSETDSELEPVLWTDVTKVDAAKAVELVGADKGAPVETMSLRDFFRAVPKEDRPRFDELSKVLTENLSEIQVYKIGETEKQVLVIGKAAAGAWAGVKLTVVET